MILYKDEVCAKVLFDLKIPKESILQAKAAFDNCPQLAEVLSCPAVPKSEKYAAVDKIFPENIRNFIKVMIEFDHIGNIENIFDAYKKTELESKNIITAELAFVNRPEDEIINRFKDMLKKKYNASDVELILKQDDSLIGGYKLTVGDFVYDKSVLGTVKALRSRLIRR